MVTWEQKHLSVAICVYCIMSDSKEFFSLDGVFQRSMGFNKTFSFSSTMLATFGKY